MSPPQQGDSNLGWVGGHQWGRSWRDRPPAHRPPTQVCWLGPEPQGTPNHTFLPPSGSPSHHLEFKNRDPAQNSGPDLAVGVPGPESQLFSLILEPKMPNSQFSGRVLNLSATHSNGFGGPGAQGGPRGPRGPQGGPKGALAPPSPKGPKGAQGAPWGPWGPCWGVPLRADYTGTALCRCLPKGRLLR